MRGLDREQTDQVWWAVCNNWEGISSETILTPIYDPDKNPLTFDITADLRALPGSVLAWSELARNDCGVTLQQAYDTTINWGFVQAITTATHEVGHALGHHHVQDRAALMYPQITNTSMSRRGFPNATDINQHKRLGYRIKDNPLQPPGDDLYKPRDGQPDEPSDPPKPDPPKPDPPAPPKPNPPKPPEPPKERPMNILQILLQLLSNPGFLKLIQILIDLFGQQNVRDALRETAEHLPADDSRQAAIVQVLKSLE